MTLSKEQDGFWEAAEPLWSHQRRLSSAPAEVDAIVARLGIGAGATVLDLCCGVGRHTVELARRGLRATGVDATRDYLDKAARYAQAEGLQVELVQDDMRTFCRPGAFDAVLNLGRSFGYFDDPDDDRRVVTNVYASLAAGGAFVLETIGKEGLARVFRPRYWREKDGAYYLYELKISRNWSWVEDRTIVFDDRGRTELVFSYRLYSAVELITLLRECGFAEVEVSGDLAGSPYDHRSRRLIAVARK